MFKLIGKKIINILHSKKIAEVDLCNIFVFNNKPMTANTVILEGESHFLGGEAKI